VTPQEYYERFKGKACKTLPRDCEEKDRREIHRIKMEMKEYLRKHPSRQMPKPHILANISKHHEFYGDTPAEHEARKRENNS
jgi:hypothetical protein